MFLSRIRSVFHHTEFRLTLWYSGLFVTGVLILFILFYYLLSASVKKKDTLLIQEKLSRYQSIEFDQGIAKLVDHLRVEAALNRQAGFFVLLTRSDGFPLILTTPSEWKSTLSPTDQLPTLKNESSPSLFNAGPRFYLDEIQPREDEIEYFGRFLSSGDTIIVGISMEGREEYLEQYRDVFILIIIPVFLIGMTGGLLLARRFLRPVKDLNQAIDKVHSGKMDICIPLKNTGSEFEQLAGSFNQMISRIKTLVDGMGEALDNIAHDLRTPLFRMRSIIESTIQTDDAPQYREALLDCAVESGRITEMLKVLMDISEAETGTMQLYPTRVDLIRLIEETIAIYDYLAEDKKISISTELPASCLLDIDPGRIHQAIANLLDNAVKYTPSGGDIHISVNETDIEVELRITDSGIGISEKDQSRIFDRLFRADASRSQRGQGLGLTLVQAVVKAHHGEIHVESQLDKGTCVIVLLQKTTST